MSHYSYPKMIWRQFLRHRLGAVSLFVVALFFFAGIYAPFLASSQPIVLSFDGQWYFPLFRYLFYSGFYTKYLDLFFNLMIFTVPLGILIIVFGRYVKTLIGCIVFLQVALFTCLILFPVTDPASDIQLTKERRQAFLQLRQEGKFPTFSFDLRYMSPYEKLEKILNFRLKQEQHRNILSYAKDQTAVFTLWNVEQAHEMAKQDRFNRVIKQYESGEESHEAAYTEAMAALLYIKEKNQWLKEQNANIAWMLMPLIRHYHWEDDAGGDQSMNQFLPWWELTRINRKDLVAALIFGVRISLVVGVLAVSLAMCIGIPIGSIAGYYGGAFDIIACRLLEIWESMPTFFMLLLIVAITKSKSIFLVIAVVGVFGWTGFSRYIRGEFFKQRNLAYVEACRSLGFSNRYIMFVHILPNAIPPILTLLPFAIMGAITSEAGLSFLGLGEEGSCSWGVLMDEGRSAFPAESFLLWPPAILLTVLLVAIALVGDALRDTLDPKMRR